MRAPKILAKKRIIAAEIKKIAEENFIPVIENPPLARNLYKYAEPGSEVPPMYYKAVAEILAFVFKLKKRKSSGISFFFIKFIVLFYMKVYNKY